MFLVQVLHYLSEFSKWKEQVTSSGLSSPATKTMANEQCMGLKESESFDVGRSSGRSTRNQARWTACQRRRDALCWLKSAKVLKSKNIRVTSGLFIFFLFKWAWRFQVVLNDFDMFWQIWRLEAEQHSGKANRVLLPECQTMRVGHVRSLSDAYDFVWWNYGATTEGWVKDDTSNFNDRWQVCTIRFAWKQTKEMEVGWLLQTVAQISSTWLISNCNDFVPWQSDLHGAWPGSETHIELFAYKMQLCFWVNLISIYCALFLPTCSSLK